MKLFHSFGLFRHPDHINRFSVDNRTAFIDNDFMFSAIRFYWDILYYLLTTIGMWKVFGKCGAKKWHALIPAYRFYVLAVCADRKDTGRIWFLLDIANIAVSMAGIFTIAILNLTGAWSYAIQILIFAVGITEQLFIIKIYASLCDMFSRKKWWVVFFIFNIPVIFIWGISGKFRPNSTIQDRVIRAAALTNRNVEEKDEGLTINIRKRTVKSVAGTKVLLRDIHMHIAPGRMVLLLGGSGAGKTTFLNAVTGFEKADASITLNGKDVYKDFEEMKYDIGFVPQMDLIRYNDSVLMTVSDSAKLKLPASMRKEDLNSKISEVMNIFGLKAVQNNIVSKQSGGQKKRISIATEFIADPYLFILDEPDSGLDGVLARDLMRRLHEISREGRIVIVITHSPDRVADFFDDVIILAKDAERTGRLVFCGEIEKARTFFGTNTMEEMVRMINRKEEGGEGMADELIEKFGRVNSEN